MGLAALTEPTHTGSGLGRLRRRYQIATAVVLDERAKRRKGGERSMTSRTVTIWIVMDESGDCEVATDKDVAVDRWNDEFLQVLRVSGLPLSLVT